jgi:hypothetical protein
MQYLVPFVATTVVFLVSVTAALALVAVTALFAGALAVARADKVGAPYPPARSGALKMRSEARR